MIEARSNAKTSAWVEELLTDSPIAHLATSSKQGRPHVIPICYAYDGNCIYSSIDEKPKRAKPNRLRRVLNVTENPQVCLIVDEYKEDWSKLRYVMVRGSARILHSGDEHERAISLLREKYPQYHAMKLQDRPIIKIERLTRAAWSSSNN